MLQDYRTAVCPFIDVVDYNNMEYRAQDEGARGAFDWQLYYKRQVPVPTFKKLWFRFRLLKKLWFRFRFLLLKSYGSGSGSSFISRS
jgi:hypothetical protein